MVCGQNNVANILMMLTVSNETCYREIKSKLYEYKILAHYKQRTRKHF